MVQKALAPSSLRAIARDFLFNLDHPQVTFCLIVGKGEERSSRKSSTCSPRKSSTSNRFLTALCLGRPRRLGGSGAQNTTQPTHCALVGDGRWLPADASARWLGASRGGDHATLGPMLADAALPERGSHAVNMLHTSCVGSHRYRNWPSDHAWLCLEGKAKCQWLAAPLDRACDATGRRSTTQSCRHGSNAIGLGDESLSHQHAQTLPAEAGVARFP